jgi:triosephosphate isomerase
MKFDEIYPSHAREHLDIVLCPPSLLIPGMMELCRNANIQLGSQNCHYLDKGAYTGEISAGMLKNFNVKFVILGHSERRAMGETSEEVSLKAIKVSEEDLTPIVCVGESLEIRNAGQARKFVSEQIERSIATLNNDFIIAYEPIWAIGTGVTASIDDIRNMHIEIRKIIGPDIKILYGGSVNIKNAADILKVENVNGVLVGGASLDMVDFAFIAKAVG